MHYIRILKPPRFLPASPHSLTAKITITTDLGESFLSANIPIVAELLYENGVPVPGFGNGREYMWRGKDGMRSLEVGVPLPVAKGKRKIGGDMVRMLIRPKDADVALHNFGEILHPKYCNESLRVSKGLVVAVRTMAIDISPEVTGENATRLGMAERSFSIGVEEEYMKSVNIWEETGESIARHIWYAALDLDRYVLSLTQLTIDS